MNDCGFPHYAFGKRAKPLPASHTVALSVALAVLLSLQFVTGADAQEPFEASTDTIATVQALPPPEATPSISEQVNASTLGAMAGAAIATLLVTTHRPDDLPDDWWPDDVPSSLLAGPIVALNLGAMNGTGPSSGTKRQGLVRLVACAASTAAPLIANNNGAPIGAIIFLSPVLAVTTNVLLGRWHYKAAARSEASKRQAAHIQAAPTGVAVSWFF